MSHCRSTCTPKSPSPLLSQHHSDTSGSEGSEGSPYTPLVRQGRKRKDAPSPAKKRCGIKLRRDDQVRKRRTTKAPAHPKNPLPLLSQQLCTLKETVGGQLSFVFKVLSAGKALSIQSHPDETGAERFHDKDPTDNRHANHKPEMAIALTPFEAMCGFCPIEEIAILIKKHREFAVFISETAKLAEFWLMMKIWVAQL